MDDTSPIDAKGSANCFPMLLPDEKIDGIDQYLWVKKTFGGTTPGTLGLTAIAESAVTCRNKANDADRTGFGKCKLAPLAGDTYRCASAQVGANKQTGGMKLHDIIYKQQCVPKLNWVTTEP